MAATTDLLLGEFPRTLDERYRLGMPPELLEPLTAAGQELVLAKERSGCLSLWSAATWKPRLDAAVDVLRSKLAAGSLAQRLDQVQDLGRLLSTRQRTVSLAGRGRLVIPEHGWAEDNRQPHDRHILPTGRQHFPPHADAVRHMIRAINRIGIV
jgi:MraZ protein